MRPTAALLAVLAIGCKGGGDRKPPPAAARDAEPVMAAPDVTREGMGETIPPPPPLPDAPRGLPRLPEAAHNPLTPAAAELGALLFFEPRLSAGAVRACAGCHQPEHGWADGEPRAKTVAGQLNLRHTPTLWNAGYHRTWAWDGSMPTLEAHILSHWKGQLGAEPEAVADALARSPGYLGRFERTFKGPPTRERIAEALAAFVRTLTSGDSPWDRREAGTADAVGPDAIEGARVFNETAGCAVCHAPPLYSDLAYHARGVGDDSDPGRARVTGDAADQGAFKTTGLRGLLHTAPYFHDGSAATLDAAVDAELTRSAITLDANQRRQLLAFLTSLSPPLEPMKAPELPAVP